MDDAVRPFPMPEMTPPETKIYFVLVVDDLLRGTININKTSSQKSTGILRRVKNIYHSYIFLSKKVYAKGNKPGKITHYNLLVTATQSTCSDSIL